MNKKAIKFLLILLIIIASLFISSKVYATNENIAGIDVYDKNGNDMTYMPPQSGGLCGYIDSSLNFDDCHYKLTFCEEKNYDEVVKLIKKVIKKEEQNVTIGEL